MKISKLFLKNRPVFVVEMKVSDLDSYKCSSRFLHYNFDSDTLVFVECNKKGVIKLTPKKGEYRILVVPIFSKLKRLI